MRPDLLLPALVWVCDAEGSPHGAGVFFADKQVLTCAHVVMKALAMNSPSDAAPVETLTVRFTHVSDDAPRRVRVRGDAWYAPGQQQDDPGSGDVAVLNLLDELPAGAHAIPSFGTEAGAAEEIWAFGLPEDHGKNSGGWAPGVLAGPQASGWIQINSRSDGYPIQQGFSGAAAWSEQSQTVVGIVVAADSSPDARVGWMIPTSFLAKVCPLILVTESDAVSQISSIQEPAMDPEGTEAPDESQLQVCCLLVRSAMLETRAAIFSGYSTPRDCRRLDVADRWCDRAQHLITESAPSDLQGYGPGLQTWATRQRGLIGEARWYFMDPAVPLPKESPFFVDLRTNIKHIEQFFNEWLKEEKLPRQDLDDSVWPVLGFANQAGFSQYLDPTVHQLLMSGDPMISDLRERLLANPEFTPRGLWEEGYPKNLVFDFVNAVIGEKWAKWIHMANEGHDWTGTLTPVGQHLLTKDVPPC
jgi:hypothetical protein